MSLSRTFTITAFLLLFSMVVCAQESTADQNVITIEHTLTGDMVAEAAVVKLGIKAKLFKSLTEKAIIRPERISKQIQNTLVEDNFLV